MCVYVHTCCICYGWGEHGVLNRVVKESLPHKVGFEYVLKEKRDSSLGKNILVKGCIQFKSTGERSCLGVGRGQYYCDRVIDGTWY